MLQTPIMFPDSKRVVALSGGKDSCAMAFWLAENEPGEYIYIYTPTGDELPEMADHWKRIQDILKTPILSLNPGLTFTELIYEQQMIPNFRARFCTRILKIEPTEQFIQENGWPILYVGLRADEPDRKGGIYNVPQRFPLREIGWGVNDVWAYLDSKGVSIPPRTDCAQCFFQRIGEWWDLWHYHPDLFENAVQIEKDIGYTFRTPKKGIWPIGLADLRVEFEKGRVPKGARVDIKNTENRNICRACSL